MKSEFFIDALEFLDDKLLIEANEKRVNRKKIIYIRTAVAAAACVVLVLIAGLLLGGPFADSPKLLAGKDWRFLREGGLFLPEETDNPQFVATVTETPAPTEASSTLKPTKRPAVTVTNRPVVNTSAPATNSPVTNTAAPATNRPVVNTATPDAGYNESEPVVPDYDIPSPTSSVTTEKPDEWTTYMAKNETTEGIYGLEENLVMAWFASALNVEYVEPTATPTATPEPAPTVTPIPTVIPTGQPTSVPTQTPSEPGDIYPGPPPEPGDSSDEPTSPGDDVEIKPESISWSYSLKVGAKNYIWQKKEISSAVIKDYIGSNVLNGTSSNNKKESTSAAGYSIKGVSTDFALAAKVKGLSAYYLFTNATYTPNTLKAYVTDLNLKEYLKWNTLATYGNKMTTTNVSSDKIWGILANTDGQRVEAKTVYLNNTMAGALIMDMEVFGYNDIPVALYKEGYMIISLFDQTHAFRIGAEKISELLK